MKKSRFTEEQILYALRQVEAGTPPADVCRQLGCSEASFYLWKKRYGSLGITEIRELRQLRDENARLKRVVADLTLGQAHPERGRPKKTVRAARRRELAHWIRLLTGPRTSSPGVYL
jgi:putative transposase